MKTIEEKWEKFRVENEIPCETFVSTGYFFFELMCEFWNKENELVRKEMEKRLREAEDVIRIIEHNLSDKMKELSHVDLQWYMEEYFKKWGVE